jgi:hypothetical protein
MTAALDAATAARRRTATGYTVLPAAVAKAAAAALAASEQCSNLFVDRCRRRSRVHVRVARAISTEAHGIHAVLIVWAL